MLSAASFHSCSVTDSSSKQQAHALCLHYCVQCVFPTYDVARACCLLVLAGKGPRDMLFDTFDATDLNKELKGLMDGLSVKVRQQ
jgi:hypothetical protein